MDVGVMKSMGLTLKAFTAYVEETQSSVEEKGRKYKGLNLATESHRRTQKKLWSSVKICVNLWLMKMLAFSATSAPLRWKFDSANVKAGVIKYEINDTGRGIDEFRP
jgi:hypothetical protein